MILFPYLSCSILHYRSCKMSDEIVVHLFICLFANAMSSSYFSTTSEIIQVLLKDIMKGFFNSEKQVRISALQVVAIILRQGLIHPAQVKRIP